VIVCILYVFVFLFFFSIVIGLPKYIYLSHPLIFPTTYTTELGQKKTPKIEVTNEDKVRVRFNGPWIEMVRVK
jgi:hypothetical protein